MAANDIDELLVSVLDEMLIIFDCDRAWLLYPCDPAAPTWSVPVERTRPEWPGAFAQGHPIETDAESAEVFRQAIESNHAVTYDVSSGRTMLNRVTEQFSIQSQMVLAIHPKSSQPWLLGIHHCAKAHVFNAEEQRLLSEISQSITASLSNLIAIKALRESERYNRMLFEQSPIGLALCHLNGELVDINPAYAAILGRSVEETLTLTYWDITPEKYAAEEARQLESLEATGRYGPYEKEYIHKSGHLIPVRLSGMFFERSGEKFIWSSVEDITEHKKAEQALYESQKMLQLVLDSIPVRVFWKDTESRYLGCNKLFAMDAGLESPELIVGKSDFDLGWKEQAEIYRDDDRHVIQSRQPKLNYEEPQTSPDGTSLWLKTSKIPLTDLSQTVIGVMGTYEDITEHKRQEEQILYQAHFDSLTNIPNRFLALDRLAQMIKEAYRSDTKVAVLFLDLDDFKKINDSLGHEVGDRLLVQAAKRLGSVLRDTDTIGRLGGDEFIVLVGGLADAADVRLLAENLLERFRYTFRVDGREMLLTASIGIAVYPDDGDNPAELLRNADIAMYHSKDQGRNAYHYFTESMNQGVSRRLALEEQLHGALARDEFRLRYQPVMNIKDRTIVGAETLLRWNNPALGEVSPAEFIQIAEQTGLIVPIGEYILTEALTKTAQWQQNGFRDFKIAINISPHQFRNPNLLPFITKVLKKTGVSGDSLQLEITEGVLMNNHAHVYSALEDLNQLGVSIAMDDFGTGYSSLSYLRNFPFDILKIDRSFVYDITVDKTSRELANATIAMGKGLGLKVVAEGVETEEQLTHLRDHGCDFAQGYLFSKPVSHEKISKWLN